MPTLSCYQVSIPACPDNIGIVAGLQPNSTYRYELTSKFGIIYNGLSATNEFGVLFIPVATNDDMPPGLFTQYSGTFVLQVFLSQNNAYTPGQFVINGNNYDLLEISFKVYKPAIGAFDPNAPVFVPVDDNNIVIVDDIPARDALELAENTFVFVRDATGDSDVSEGDALYLYDAINSTYIRITSPSILSNALILD